MQNAAFVAPWLEALQYMHGCRANMKGHENCCRCETSFRTILMFRLPGYDQLSFFLEKLMSP